jgi:hypothetical protein
LDTSKIKITTPIERNQFAFECPAILQRHVDFASKESVDICNWGVWRGGLDGTNHGGLETLPLRLRLHESSKADKNRQYHLKI